ncbi:MerR family DNA-binding protein, partial [Salmonella enterica subsp. enterica serovar Enteritidis]|uniref:MerR family DNA-binding protein n=1 Tax=Salmonella enterica TaxID=28901 RepID=UPI0039E8ED42
MKLILRGRKFGFQLEEIRQWLLIYDKEGDAAQNRAFIEMADRQQVREMIAKTVETFGKLDVKFN